MPPKSKKRLAAERREAQKAEKREVSGKQGGNAYNPPQYRPRDPSLQPYWDAFYENPYPSADERRVLSERLNMSPQTIKQWFIMARRFTHAPDKGPEDDDFSEVEGEELDDEEVSIRGGLYRYFYQDVIAQKLNTRSASKRKSSNDEAAGAIEPKPIHQRGLRGPYTKQSLSTFNRQQRHARKYASPIDSFFPVAIQHVIVDSDSESEEVVQLSASSSTRGQPVGICATCSQSEEARTRAEKAAQEQMRSDPSFYRSLEDTGLDDDPLPQAKDRSSTCCMRRCLSLQQDFLDEKPRIQIMIEQAGHRCLFLPKFHCELNPIEMYWGYAKRLFRERSDGTITTARKLVPECLGAASISTIRHFWCKSWRYMDAYMNGLTGKQAEFAVKKFKSHRRIGKNVMIDTTLIPK